MGPWKVFSATRKAGTAGGPNLPVRTSVSVWTCSPGKGAQRAKVVEQLRRSVTTLSRLRHPCILEIVEPVEESRGEVLFATEPVLATLASCLGSKHPDFQVDEIETQKGLLQVRSWRERMALTSRLRVLWNFYMIHSLFIQI